MKNIQLCILLCLSLSISQAQTALQKVLSTDWTSGDQFGRVVAMDGHTAIVGAKQESHDVNGQNEKAGAGAAYIFEFDSLSNSWNQLQKLVASDRQGGDQFGFSVAIEGDYILVGANKEDEDENGMNTANDAGSVYVFEKNANGMWDEVQKLVSFDNRRPGQEFGRAVALEGNAAFIGAYHEGTGSNPSSTFWQGAVFVFQRDANGVWTSFQKIKANNIGYAAEFGSSISVDGRLMVVGARGERRDANGQNTLTGAGAAYFFHQNDTSGLWEYVQKVSSPYRAQNNLFAESVSLDGTFAVVGDAKQDYDSTGMDPQNSAGAAVVYQNQSDGSWRQVAMLVSPFRSANALFGHSVSISEDQILVGSPRAALDANGDSSLSRAGAAYLFARDPQGDWLLTESITATDRQVQAEFGDEVCIQAGRVAIAAKELEAVYLSVQALNNTSLLGDIGNMKISLYPNPCEDYIILETPLSSYHASFYHANGQLLRTYTHLFKNTKLSISHLPPGLYFIKIFTPQTHLSTIQKIVKQ